VKKSDVCLIICLFLILMLMSTGISGFIQVKLDLHRTTIHKFSAYFTLSLAAIHVLLHFEEIVNRVKNVFKR
jgi:hypothetical protein